MSITQSLLICKSTFDAIFTEPSPQMSGRSFLVLLWLTAVGIAGFMYFFHHDALQQALAGLAERPSGWRYTAYLVLGCLRGFTLIPVTYLVVAGMLVLPPLPLYLLTVAGIVVSSAAVYYFAERLRLGAFFERRYAPQVRELRAVLARRELPIVIAWSFFPMAPTDVICYICGALKVDLKKCLLGVTLGEGTICAIYIVIGTRMLSWLR